MQKKIRYGHYNIISKRFLAQIGNHVEDITNYIDDDTKALFELQSLLIENQFNILTFSFTGIYDHIKIDFESIY